MTTATTTEQPAATITTDKQHAAETILKRCVCMILSCGYLGNSKKVDLTHMKLAKVSADGSAEQTLTDKEKKQVRATKVLVDSKHLQACTREIEAAKNALRARSAAMGHRVFGPGTYLIPYAGLMDAVNDLKERQARVRIHRKALADKWEAIVTARAAELGPLYNPKEFPTRDEVMAAFDIDWSFVSFSAPEQLIDVDRALFEQAEEQNKQKMADAFDEVVVQLRAAALTVMRELADRLKPNPKDGKPKALHATALRDLQTFIQNLPKRNIVGDDELTAVVEHIADYAQGIDVETLKKAPAVRAGLQAAAEDAVKVLEGLVTAANTRAISFGPLTPDAP